jgi:membrane-bound metal-dependent hydrolase YbcI (DUF457 family)
MPFTPFHLGPGLAIKALGGHRISLLVFAGTQVLMDIEPLLGLLGLIDSLHGVSHSLAGALLIGLLATLTGRPIGNRMLRLLRWPAPPMDWPAAALGAFVGSLSHIALDALMHADIQPLWPLTTANPLRDALSWSALHGGCALLGLLGLLVIGLRHYHQARRR